MGRRLIARSTMLLREGRNMNYKQMLHHTLHHHDELIHGVPNKDQNKKNNNNNNNSSNSSNNDNDNKKKKNNERGGEGTATDKSALWVPHPRTGIYYPKGHEWVMEDVPQGASSFPQPYWLRSGEVVERPLPTSTSTDSTSTCSKSSASSVHSSDEIFDHPFLNL